MLTLVLKNNNFTFDGDHYLQVNGPAIDTKMATSYANIFMSKLEKQLLESSIEKKLSWFRFIDDVDMKRNKSDKDIDTLINHANNIHQSISNLLTRDLNPKSPSSILPSP